MSPFRRSSILSALLAGTLLSCESEPKDLREWRPNDHDHTETPAPGQVAISDAGSSAAQMHGLDEVTFIAWRQNCVQCHGPLGKGDGPQASSVGASDLTRPEWQSAVSDGEIARIILEGRGRMPSFVLPKPTVDALVKLIRLLGGHLRASTSDAGTPKPDAAIDGSVSQPPKKPNKAPAQQ
jgi:mono/diheme cytochrome c family protein